MKELVTRFQPGEGPSRGLLCDCATSPINRFAALGWTGRLEPGPGRRLDGEAGHCSTVAGVMEAADHCYTHPGEYQQQ